MESQSAIQPGGGGGGGEGGAIELSANSTSRGGAPYQLNQCVQMYVAFIL